MSEKWTCYRCGHRNEGPLCSVCGDLREAQEAEMARDAEAEMARELFEEGLHEEARNMAEGHLDSIRDDLSEEVYSAELRKLTDSEYRRLLENEFRGDE